MAQEEIISENSWIEKIKNELQSVGIYLSFDEISNYPKNQFKSLVKKKLSVASKEYLQRQQNLHTKTTWLSIQDKIQKYLTSHKLTLLEKQNIYKLQARVVHVKNNYKSMYPDVKCIFCRGESSIDCVEHYLKCDHLLRHDKLKNKIHNVKFSDLFGDIEAQTKFVRLWLEIEKVRQVVTEARPEL